MFVFLSKFLPPLFYPIGLTLILMVVALILYRQRRLQRAALITAVVILLIGSNHWVAYSLTRSLEWQYLPSGEIPTADAIVLLGGGTDPAELPRPLVQVNGAGERVIYAAYLYKQGKAPVILVTSAVHMPRSVALFQTQGIQVIPAPSDFTVTQAGWDDLTHATLATQVVNWLPSIGNLDMTTNALKEYIGNLVYRLRGWIR